MQVLRQHCRRAVAPMAVAMLAVLLTVLLASGPIYGEAPAEMRVSRFDTVGLEGWEQRRFDGRTDYRLVSSEAGTVVEAVSEDSASGLFRELDVDATELPRLAWRWWVEEPVATDAPRRKIGDDFAARVYVVFSGGLAFWRTTSLVYVWAPASVPVGSHWPNPYTANARTLVVRSGGGGRWHDERRDVAADYRRLFGREPPPVIAVALMTDTDQTGRSARARYGALRFLPPAGGAAGGTSATGTSATGTSATGASAIGAEVLRTP